MIDYIKTVRQLTVSSNRPTIGMDKCMHDSSSLIQTVHCSAGIGRSGAFMASFIGMQELQSEWRYVKMRCIPYDTIHSQYSKSGIDLSCVSQPMPCVGCVISWGVWGVCVESAEASSRPSFSTNSFIRSVQYMCVYICSNILFSHAAFVAVE